jgi:hypothetical protein
MIKTKSANGVTRKVTIGMAQILARHEFKRELYTKGDNRIPTSADVNTAEIRCFPICDCKRNPKILSSLFFPSVLKRGE